LTNWVTTSMSVCSVELTVCTEFLVPSWFTLWRYTTAATLYGGLKFCGMVVHDESMQIYEVFQPIRESRNIILRVIFPMFGPCEWNLTFNTFFPMVVNGNLNFPYDFHGKNVSDFVLCWNPYKAKVIWPGNYLEKVRINTKIFRQVLWIHFRQCIVLTYSQKPALRRRGETCLLTESVTLTYSHQNFM